MENVENKTEKKTVRLPKEKKTIIINKYDFQRAYLLEDGINYIIAPPVNDFDEEEKTLINFYISRGKNRNFICEELKCSPNKLLIYMDEEFGTKKITKIRELIVTDNTGRFAAVKEMIDKQPKKNNKKKITAEDLPF